MRQGVLVVLVVVPGAIGVTTWLLIRTVDAAGDIEPRRSASPAAAVASTSRPTR
jgi:hypothetical protein